MFVPPELTRSGIGPADYVAHVHPGQVLELEYAPPAHYLSPGSLGPGSQQHIGDDAYWRMVRIIAICVAGLAILVSAALG